MEKMQLGLIVGLSDDPQKSFLNHIYNCDSAGFA